jgi:hypothetical protein
MSGNNRHRSDESSLATCALCGQVKENVHTGVCVSCVEATLRNYLPLLQCLLEERYGQQLDSWLENGRFCGAYWDIKSDFRIGQEHLQGFLADVIVDAIRTEAIKLVLPRSGGWAPVTAETLTGLFNEQYGEEFHRLATHLFARTIRRASTKAVEREIIGAVISDSIASTWHREYAIELAAYTIGNTLPPSASVLLTLRYRSDKSGRPYTGFWEGEIDHVWKECAESLPPEVARLISKDESHWL